MSTELDWPAAIALLGLIGLVMFIIGVSLATWLENRKLQISAEQQENMRQLVSRDEQLAEKGARRAAAHRHRRR